MTVWPGVPVPLPPLNARRREYSLHESGLAIIGRGDWVEVSGRLGEVYLELNQLDLDELEQMLAFAHTYGTPSGSLGELTQHSWFAGHLSSENAGIRDQILRAEPELAGELAEITTLESFRFVARLFRDLTDAWRAVNLDPDVDLGSHSWQLPYPVDVQTTRTRFFALQLISEGLTRLLTRFRPYLHGTPAPDDYEATDLDQVSDEAEPHRGVFLQAAPSITFAQLPEFCATELFNHIVRGEVYRRCQNETCGKTFTVQYGRHKSHRLSKREGVLYCSYKCAQAQAARNYRRRRRARTQPAQ